MSIIFYFFFFKQKTAYELRISDWSSDVCSSDIDERQELRDGVLQDIARSSSHSQQLIGPMIVVPFRKDARVWNTNEKTGVRFLETVEQSGELYFLTEQLDVDGQISTENRSEERRVEKKCVRKGRFGCSP